MSDKDFLLEADDNINLLSDDRSDDEMEFEASKGFSNNNDIQGADIDEYLKQGGEYGRYQIMVQLLLLVTALSHPYPAMIFYYIGFDPPWKCTHHNINSTYNNTYTNTSSNGCYGNITYEHTNDYRCTLNRSEWHYDYNKKTVVTEFDLVCDKSWLDALVGSVTFLGWGAGIVVTGYLSDRFGRKKIMLPCLFLTLLFLFLTSVCQNIQQLVSARFLTGFFFSSPALNTFVLLMESVGPTKRALATTLGSFVWPLGSFILTLKAKYIDSWRILIMVCSLPYMLTIVSAFFLPESVRWLNLKGRNKEAEEILKKAARINKRTLPPIYLKLPETYHKHGKKASYLDLFKTWKILKLVLVQFFLWFTTGLVFYALSWSFADLGSDMYLNFMLSFAVEIPATILALYLMEKIGRKKTSILTYVFTALFSLAVAFTPIKENVKELRVVFGLCGKFMIAMSFSLIYLWSSEVYATVLRSQGMGINIVASRAGAATSPFIKLLDRFHPSAPFVFMAVLSSLAALLCLVMPETLNKPTRETLDDMLNEVVPSHELRTIYSLDDDSVRIPKQTSINRNNDDNNMFDSGENENDLLLLPNVHVFPLHSE